MQGRSVLRNAALTLASAPFFKPSHVLAAPADEIALQYVHPELRALAAQILPALSKSPPLSRSTLPQNGALTKAMARPRLADVPVEKITIPGGAGNPDVTIYVINAKPDANKAGIVHTHGGGRLGLCRSFGA